MFDDTDTYQAVTAVLIRFFTATQQQYAIYGAGKFTKQMVAYLQTSGLQLPALILDDHPPSNSIAGILVQMPTADILKDDYVTIMGTDTWQDPMRANFECRFPSRHLIDLKELVKDFSFTSSPGTAIPYANERFLLYYHAVAILGNGRLILIASGDMDYHLAILCNAKLKPPHFSLHVPSEMSEQDIASMIKRCEEYDLDGKDIIYIHCGEHLARRIKIDLAIAACRARIVSPSTYRHDPETLGQSENDQTLHPLEMELQFWDRSIRENLKHNSPEAFSAGRSAAFPKLVSDFLRDECLSTHNHLLPDGLEIGSGPFSHLFYGVETGILNSLVAVDPLADEYAVMNQQKGLSSPLPILYGTGENLPASINGSTFDFVYMRNSLDHTEYPQLCLRNAVSILKPGGLLFIISFIREGSQMNWHQLHRHDLLPRNGSLFLFDRLDQATNLTTVLPLECLLQRRSSDLPGNRSFTMVFRKKLD